MALLIVGGQCEICGLSASLFPSPKCGDPLMCIHCERRDRRERYRPCPECGCFVSEADQAAHHPSCSKAK